MRRAAKNSPALDSPAAYFRWSLKNGVTARKGMAQQGRGVAPAEAAPPSLREQFIAHRSRDAIAYYQELADIERTAILERFKSSKQGRGVNLEKGLDSPLVRSALGLWLMKDLWGDPSDFDLVRFAEARQEPANKDAEVD
ncbi:MAG: hypothetical protein ABSF50_23180 [Burkholderiaceae bacterium]